jgi:NitT/TauT family transport system ATP-binding protein
MAKPESTGVTPPMKIDVRRVTYEYREHGTPVCALEDVSFTVGEREIVTLVGPSGCGKTTLLHIVAGFFKPTAGVVLVDGTEVSAPGPERGIVFQNYALFRWLTVRGNVEFGPRMRGVSHRERRQIAEHYLSLVGLTSFADKYVYQLSGGMQQRVALARVLANRPDILLMDEPFAALDAQTRELLQEELLRIWGRVQNTILFVTHSVDEAIFLSNRVIVFTFRPGRIHSAFDIALPAPRYDYRIRTSPEYNKLKEEVSTAVRDQVATQRDSLGEVI